MKSYLFSQLVQQLQRGDARAFAAAHPYPWLVWEPGTWRPPLRNQGTLIIAAGQTSPKTGGEALVFALIPKPGREGQLVVGRAPGNDISINDATLSQTHLVLREHQGSWTVRDAGSSNGTWVDGVKLEPGVPVPVADGAQLRAAEVTFTFLGPQRMLARLTAALSGHAAS